jgi:hypothetical protein
MSRYRDVPVEYMAGAVIRYIENGTPPGSFLMALFSNDLKGSYRCADDKNASAMRAWVAFMYNEMPGNSQGSPEKVSAWIARGGLLGVKQEESA